VQIGWVTRLALPDHGGVTAFAIPHPRLHDDPTPLLLTAIITVSITTMLIHSTRTTGRTWD
jgi:hypothetical protein